MAYLSTWPANVEECRAISFTPNSTTSFVLAFRDQEVAIYSSEANNAIQALVTPWLETELADLDFDYQVDFIFLTHPNHEPRIIKYDSTTNPQFTISKLQEETTWKAPPFLKEDTSSTELIVSDEVHYVKLVGDDPSTFSTVPANLNTTVRYIELRVNNKWAIYRLVDQNVSASVPADPTATECYAEPVSAVVDGFPESANFCLMESTYDELGITITANERELRSDTLVFNYDLEGAWARVDLGFGSDVISGEPLKLWSGGYDTSDTVWVQLQEYIGTDDFSTHLWEGAANGAVALEKFWEIGHVYKIVTPDTFEIRIGGTDDGTGTKTWSSAFLYNTAGDSFVLENHWEMNDGGGATPGSTSTQIADLSRANTFDVMKTDAPVTLYTPPAGTNITFDDTASFHTATLKASKSLFAATDVGRSVMVKYATTWTTYNITAFTSATEVDVDVVDLIPISNEKGEYELNGRSSTFRLSAWKSGDYPYTVAFYEQRLCFGGNPSNPETLWFSKVTDNYDFRTIESDGEVLDTTGITYPLGGRSFNKIKWLSAGPTLMIGTESSEWQLKPNNFRAALTPTNVRITLETTEGSALFAIRAGSSLVFPERTGEFIRQLAYNFQIDQFEPQDLTLLADHLFREDPVVDFAYQTAPKPTFWFVTTSGLVYLMAYNTAQDVLAWSRFQTRVGDKVLSVAVMDRNATITNDRVYLMVQRGSTVYVEYVPDQFYEETVEDDPTMIFVDNAEIYDLAAPTSTLTGLGRFDTETVRVVVDNVDKGTVTVSGSEIDLTTIEVALEAQTSAVVGYDYTSRVITNPLSMAVDAGANYGKRARLVKLGGYFYQSVSMKYGDKDDTLEAIDFDEENFFTGFVEDLIMANKFTLENQLQIEVDEPYPFTIMCLLPEM